MDDACCSPMRSIPRTARRRWPMWRRAQRADAADSLAGRRCGDSCAGHRRCAQRWRRRSRSRLREIDLPLAPVLYRMEHAGVRIDTAALSGLSRRFGAGIESRGRAAFSSWRGSDSTSIRPSSSAKFCSLILDLPPPVGSRQRKAISTAQDVLEQLAEAARSSAAGARIPAPGKLKSNYVDALPLLADSDSRVHTTFQAAATATGRLSSVNPNLQNIPDAHRTGPRDSRRIYFSAGHAAAFGGLLADRAAAAGAFQRRSAADARLRRRIRHPHADGERSFRRAHRQRWTRKRATAPRR